VVFSGFRGDGEGGDGGWMCRSRVGDGGLVGRAVTGVWTVVWAGPHGTAVRGDGMAGSDDIVDGGLGGGGESVLRV
jgi:hypothetical protein